MSTWLKTPALSTIILSVIIRRGQRLRVFRTKAFSRFSVRVAIPDADLLEAVLRAESGLIDADLGGGVIKQRIARQGGGKSGGFRTIVLFRRGALAFFVHGFAKSDQDNIDRDELKGFRKLAGVMLAMNDDKLAVALAKGAIVEVR